MIARYRTAVAVGGGVTFGLLFIMQLLIATGEEAVTDAERFRMDEFVRVERNEIIETKKQKPEKPPEPEIPPDKPAPQNPNQCDYSMDVAVTSPSTPALRSVPSMPTVMSPIISVARSSTDRESMPGRIQDEEKNGNRAILFEDRHRFVGRRMPVD